MVLPTIRRSTLVSLGLLLTPQYGKFEVVLHLAITITKHYYSMNYLKTTGYLLFSEFSKKAYVVLTVPCMGCNSCQYHMFPSRMKTALVLQDVVPCTMYTVRAASRYHVSHSNIIVLFYSSVYCYHFSFSVCCDVWWLWSWPHHGFVCLVSGAQWEEAEELQRRWRGELLWNS